MISQTLISSLLLAGSALAGPLTKRLPENPSIAAFGDSFSAGIGTGYFWHGQSNDGRDNMCARTDGSYPVHLRDYFTNRADIPLTFASCSGDKLANVQQQVQSLLGKKVDLATLSISGNDFKFGKVVSNCVYPVRTKYFTEAKAQAGCEASLALAEGAIDDDANWQKFVSQARLIKDTLNSNGALYITGYAKFFSPGGSEGDACDEKPFFNSGWINRLLGVLPMKNQNRQRMNSLVDRVNAKIQSEVVSKLSGEMTVVFVDIDSHFNGRRFCEPGEDPWGSNDRRVLFNDLFTTLEETGDWQGPVKRDDDEFWAEIPDDVSDPGFAGRGITDKYQKASVFHPKEASHQITAAKIFIDATSRYPLSSVTKGPGKICQGAGPGGGGNDQCFDVPSGCVGTQSADGSQPKVVCKDGRLLYGAAPGPNPRDQNGGRPVLKEKGKGTKIHVKDGCIYINDSKRCAGDEPYNVAFEGKDVSKATFLGKLPSDSTSAKVTAGCKLEAIWPYYYGDVYYGEGDCLYDSSGAKLADQCCTEQTDAQVNNPYASSS